MVVPMISLTCSGCKAILARILTLGPGNLYTVVYSGDLSWYPYTLSAEQIRDALKGKCPVCGRSLGPVQDIHIEPSKQVRHTTAVYMRNQEKRKRAKKKREEERKKKHSFTKKGVKGA
jgi:hypothetical protein